MRTEKPSGVEVPFWRLKDFWCVEFSALLPRIAFLMTTSGMRKSADVYTWQAVAKALLSNINPYVSILTWPPFWMQVIYVLDRISVKTGLSFVACLFGFLLCAELTLIASLYALLRRLRPKDLPGRLLFWAVSLNPVLILLTCQHGNFDVLVGLSATLFLLALVSYQENGDLMDWLLACTALGVGILIKTTPLVLTPLLFRGIGRLPMKTKCLGGILTIGPVLLGMSIIYVLAPYSVRENVIGYRSIPGYFGITGVLSLLQLNAMASLYMRVFPWLLTASMVGAGVWLYSNPDLEDRRQTLLVAAAAMLAVPLFGPGYAPQYLFWSIPLLITVYYFVEKKRLRVVLMAAYGIASITYIIEYSVFGSHGALLLQVRPDSATLAELATTISTRGGQTLVRLPLFFAMSSVFVMIVRDAITPRVRTA